MARNLRTGAVVSSPLQTKGPLNTFPPDVDALSIGTLSTLLFAGSHYIPVLMGHDTLAF